MRIMYFCYQAPQKEYNYKGEYLGMSEEIAIYYDRRIGRRRNYRNPYPFPMFKNLVLKKFNNRENAQKLCNYTNQEFGNHFVVREVIE